MAHTYYSRLTIVHPQDVNKLDPRAGLVIAETASTGRFIMGDISWESAVAPNADSTTAFHTFGELTIFEPLGMGLFDYIRAAADVLKMSTHLDARFLLEIEIIAEKMPEKGTPFKYIWPVMFISSEVKSSLTERGTEYNIKFVHTPYHSQTDMVQSVKENTSIDGETLEVYFKNLQKALEEREYKYAIASQKAYQSGQNLVNGVPRSPGGDNPAAKDIFHDEYHFILDPEIKNWSFDTQGVKDAGGSGSASNILRSQKLWTIPMRPGTTIIQQINKVLKATTQGIELVSSNKKNPQTIAKQSREKIEAELNKPYQYFRIETHSIYKSYDYVRGRYAVKHVFFIFLADQPNMYNYPLELDIINRADNKIKQQLTERLIYYIQEKLLQKLYYYNYTGLNTDVLKVDLNFNQAYVLPSFPYLSATRGLLGPGAMGPENYNIRVSPYESLKPLDNADLIRLATEYQVEAQRPRDASINEAADVWAQRTAEARRNLARVQEEIARRDSERSTQLLATLKNAISSRLDLFRQLKNRYAEDLKLIPDKENSVTLFNLRPRMEPDNILDQTENNSNANSKTAEKIFNVLVSARDLIELELEIIGDPFWLGMPNILSMGATSMTKIEFSKQLNDKMKEEINAKMINIDSTWKDKQPVWGEWGGAPQYKGAPLFYFLNQVPESKFTSDDLLTFAPNDQIVGIYMVRKVVNNFKGGKWTQKLMSVRDITIPGYILPKTVTGELGFEEFINVVLAPEATRAADSIAQRREAAARIRDLESQAAKAGNPIRSSNPPGVSANTATQAAIDRRDDQLIGRENLPPVVDNPVETANALVASGVSREAAYQQAQQQYRDQLKNYFAYHDDFNKLAYADSPLKTADVRPYSPETMIALAVQRSGNGGLEHWRTGDNGTVGPSIYNNPLGVGYNRANNSYYRYETWQEGLQAGMDFYNFGQGVTPRGTQGSDRFLLPKDTPKTVEAELNHIKTKGSGPNPALPPEIPNPPRGS